MKTFTASTNPVADIESISPPGQSPLRRQYKPGYERHFNALPRLDAKSPLFDAELAYSRTVMGGLAAKLREGGTDEAWLTDGLPGDGGFDRFILAIEPPQHTDGGLKEGAEVLVARWGNGHASPVHGHASGYLHEELLTGRMRVNTYRIVDRVNRVVRPLQTVIAEPGNIASEFSEPSETERDTLVHNFVSIGTSTSLHFLPEHTREGRDNRFSVEHFEGTFDLAGHLTQLTPQEGITQLRIGDVALVRSTNVADYGDHYIVVTGAPVLKAHGLRPQERSIIAGPEESALLDGYKPVMGATILKLSPEARAAFHEFHAIRVDGNEVTFQTT